MNAILIALAVVSGGAESQIPPEMKVLERMVGTWKSTSVSRVAKWTPEETRSTQTYKTELVLDGRFLHSKGFDEQGKLVNLQMFTYDPKKKTYRWWLFDSKGNAGESTGTWDEANQTLTLTNKAEGGIIGVMKIHFLDENTSEVKITWKEADGTIGFQMEGRSTRQK